VTTRPSILNALKRFLKTIGLLPLARRIAGFLLDPKRGWLPDSLRYRLRATLEKATFADCDAVHDLPPIFHYWSNKHLRPTLEAHGFSNPNAFFVHYLCRQFCDDRKRHRHLISIGAGNCDTEIALAAALIEKGFDHFTIDCLDFNDAMLARGVSLASAANVAKHIVPIKGDFNTWRPATPTQYDAVIANQSLHHVVSLEHLFDAITEALTPEGRFIVADMIGRNGHSRWPEASAIVEELWRELPTQYRYNHHTERVEIHFRDSNAPIANFEGIRAQDILPLLVTRFSFDFFYGFSNIVAPFIDRAIGPNFDPDREWDRNFIDRVHARDTHEIHQGHIKPTQMLAVMTLMSSSESAEKIYADGLTPEFCVRVVG
jgi:SAM-dependent methyltransferase